MMLTVGTEAPSAQARKKIEITYPLTAPTLTGQRARLMPLLELSSVPSALDPLHPRTIDPLVKVVHNRRNFSAGKQAIPLGGKGRYEVLILFENNGDTALRTSTSTMFCHPV